MTNELSMRWESKTRYMAALLQQDLLGDWIVLVANGGLRNRCSRLRTLAVADKAAGTQFLADLNKRRLKRGYAITS